MHPGSFVSTLAARAAAAALAVALACPAAALATTTTTTSSSSATTTTSTATTTATTSTTTTTAPKPPSASTGAASAVTFDTATLGGTVNPNGTATSSFFQYGKTTAYGLQTTTVSAGAGAANVVAAAAVSGLAPSTTYHFRLVAASTAGTVDGVDGTFTTPVTPPPRPATGGARTVTSNSAVVTGTVNPEGVPTTYEFQYGKTAAYGLHTPAVSADSGTATLAVSAALGGLSATTTYHYRLVATSAGGVVAGSDRTFKTGVAPSASATTGAAVQITQTGAVLTGTVRPAGGAARYYFQYGTSTSYSGHTAVLSAGAGTAAVAVQAPIGGLAPLTRYHFRLVVIGAGGTIAGSDRSFTTTSVPLSLTATAVPDPVGFGGAATITGLLTGSRSAGLQVVLQAMPFPYTAPFTNVGNSEVINANGSFTFTVPALAQNTRYRVAVVQSPGVVSPVLLERVAVRVSFGASERRTRRGLLARVSGSIAPGAGDVKVFLQKLVRGRWQATARLKVRVVSPALLRYARTLRLARGGRYRVLVRVTDGARLSAVSRSLLIRRPRR